MTETENPLIGGITLPVSVIKAALLHASTDDVRYYLNGIHIERTDAPRVVFVCGMDGHRVLAIRYTQEEPTRPGAWANPDSNGFILERADLLRAIKGAHRITIVGPDPSTPRHVRAFCSKKSGEDVGRWQLIKTIDVQLVDWRRPLSNALTAPERPAVYDPALLADIPKTRALLNGEPLKHLRGLCDTGVIRPRDEYAAGIVLYDVKTPEIEAVGLLMPMRGDFTRSLKQAPIWVQEMAAAAAATPPATPAE